MKKYFYISSSIWGSCEICHESLFGENFGVMLRHYVDHGCKVKHVGTETSHGDDGLWHSTVAILSMSAEEFLYLSQNNSEDLDEAESKSDAEILARLAENLSNKE